MEKTKTTTTTKKKKATKPKRVDKRNFRDFATSHVIAHFGGVNATARAIETPPNTVQYWVENGRIPEEAAKKLVGAMKARCQEVVRAATVGEMLRP